MSDSIAALRDELYLAMNRMRSRRTLPPLPDDATRVEMNVLRMIVAAESRGEKLRPGMIASWSQLTRGAVSQTLKSLERKGFIERKRVPGDSRAVSIELTGAGRAVEAEGRRICDERIMAMLEYVGEDDVREFVRIMNRMLEFNENNPWKAPWECCEKKGGASDAHHQEPGRA